MSISFLMRQQAYRPIAERGQRSSRRVIEARGKSKARMPVVCDSSIELHNLMIADSPRCATYLRQG